MRRGVAFAARCVLLGIIGCSVVACGDDEATQRKAFIEFLQVRILDKPGIHVPKLTADEIAQFGRYASHYAVIADFNAHLDDAVASPTQGLFAASEPKSLGDAVARRQEITAAGAGVEKVQAALDHELAAADAAHAALQQPDDLKKIYDLAYDRDVTEPAKVWKEVFPDIERSLKSVIALVDYIDQHRDKIVIAGTMIQVKDPALQPPLQALIDSLRDTDTAVARSRQKLAALVSGG